MSVAAGRPCVLATRSAGKLRELLPMLTAGGWQPMTLADVGVPKHPDEDGLEVFDTFEANALAKARYFAERVSMPVFADDSGLCVDALAGGPGVRSKRWGDHAGLSGQALDDANNALLLAELARRGALAPADRAAAYVCAAACVIPGGSGAAGQWVARGETHGRILEAPVGASGFGYDPLFWSDELGVTFASVSSSEKALVSHRGRAFAAVLSRVLSQVSLVPETSEGTPESRIIFVTPVDPTTAVG